MRLRFHWLVAVTGFLLFSVGGAQAQSPSVVDALKLSPIQKGVDYDQPSADDVAKCTINARKVGGKVGLVVEGPSGTILRRFVDTNSDNTVDQWSYFKDGIEVYRDIDANFNRKADQCRWFHTAGSRWGLDKNEDGVIDAWKSISAEEVTAEVVAALAGKDTARFLRLVLSQAEIESLGLGDEKAKQLAKRLETARADFEKFAGEQKAVDPASKWLQFSAGVPGVVPGGTNDSTQDIRVYENATAVVETAGKTGEVLIGTLVQVGDGWRVIGAPQSAADGGKVAAGFFFQPAAGGAAHPTSDGPSDANQKLLADLEKIDAAIEKAPKIEEKAALNAQRADLVEKVADGANSPEDRAMWLRQLADTISAAVQAGTYPDGAKRLGELFEKLAKNESDKDLVAHVRYKQLYADYGLSFQADKPDYQKIQAKWIEDLEKYVGDYPKGPETAEALLQLSMNQEFAGKEDDAIKWYRKLVADFPDSPQAKKAGGAGTRLESVGKQIQLQGTSVTGQRVDLGEYLGKVVLVHYWATWSEPAKTDMAALKELTKRYSPNFTVIGVSLDTRRPELDAYLRENPLPWPQLHEEGGLDSRLANEMGIITVPTMMLIDKDGKVVRRSLDVAEIDKELKKLLQ
jgi:thiol-disulfide isomerase/thioredoxin